MALTSDEIRRYARHLLLPDVGAQGQQRLKAATVVLIGVGGIGAPALAHLAASGVGRLRLVDPDRVDASNLHRQFIYQTEDEGALKVAAALRFAHALNPHVLVETDARALDAENAGALLAGADVVVDGLDRFPPRYALNAAAMAARVPLVSGAVGRYGGYLSVYKPWEGAEAPCFGCLTPEEPPDADLCERDGVLGPVPGVVGAMAAVEAIKEIAGLGKSLAGRLFHYDPLASGVRTVQLSRDPACPHCAGLDRGDAAP
ncbi:MAG: HesA/MoeB/ThiF family protein [Pseudomonadota bacterium]